MDLANNVAFRIPEFSASVLKSGYVKMALSYSSELFKVSYVL